MAPSRRSRSEHLAPQKQSREQSRLLQWELTCSPLPFLPNASGLCAVRSADVASLRQEIRVAGSVLESAPPDRREASDRARQLIHETQDT